jgi:undecaprenyl phosphate-alpha-L-ara4N flippase subunit ArnE
MNGSLRQILELVSFPVAIAAGQLLFKRAAGQAAGATGVNWFLEVARLPTLWLALFLYGAATLLWVRVLTTTPLSRAYPFMALAFVLVPAASYVFFQETINTRHAVGTALIVAGVLVVARA